MSGLEEARAAIRDALENRTHGVRSGTTGRGPAPLYLSVMGADEPVARELHERFGDVIEIEVAGHLYPFDTSVVVPPAPTREANLADYGLEAITVLDPPFDGGIATGSIISGIVHMSNASGSRIEWSLGDSVGEGDLCSGSGEPATVVNVRNAKGRGVGGAITLDPGESCEHPFRASTDSRDPQVGAVLPPGNYQLFVAFDVAGQRVGEAFEVVCPAVPVRIADRFVDLAT